MLQLLPPDLVAPSLPPEHVPSPAPCTFPCPLHLPLPLRVSGIMTLTVETNQHFFHWNCDGGEIDFVSCQQLEAITGIGCSCPITAVLSQLYPVLSDLHTHVSMEKERFQLPMRGYILGVAGAVLKAVL